MPDFFFTGQCVQDYYVFLEAGKQWQWINFSVHARSKSKGNKRVGVTMISFVPAAGQYRPIAMAVEIATCRLVSSRVWRNK